MQEHWIVEIIKDERSWVLILFKNNKIIWEFPSYNNQFFNQPFHTLCHTETDDNGECIKCHIRPPQKYYTLWKIWKLMEFKPKGGRYDGTLFKYQIHPDPTIR